MNKLLSYFRDDCMLTIVTDMWGVSSSLVSVAMWRTHYFISILSRACLTEAVSYTVKCVNKYWSFRRLLTSLDNLEIKPNDCRISDPCTYSAKFWTPHFAILSSTLFCFDSTFWFDSVLKLHYVHKVIIDLVHVYENLTCSIPTQLNSPGKTWKMDVNGPEKSRKTTFSVPYAPCVHCEVC